MCSRETTPAFSNGTSGNINNVNYAAAVAAPRKTPGEQMKLVANAVADAAMRAYQKLTWSSSVPLASVLEVSLNGRDGEITAADESPVMAAIIANTAASVLQTFEGETAPVLLVELEKTIAEQTELVADKRKLLAQIIRQNAIVVDREGAEPEEPVKGDLDSAMYVDALGDFETSQRLLEQLELKRKELKSEKALRVHHVIWARAAEEK